MADIEEMDKEVEEARGWLTKVAAVAYRLAYRRGEITDLNSPWGADVDRISRAQDRVDRISEHATDALMAAVEKRERARVYEEEKSRANREMRALSDRAMANLRARTSEEDHQNGASA